MNDDDIEATDDPVYKAGLLVGRQRAFADVIAYLMSHDGGRPEQQHTALIHWCRTVLEACQDELAMVAAELRDEAA